MSGRPSSAYNAGVAEDRRFSERFQTTLDLWATGVALQRQTIRRKHPDASDDDIDRMLTAWLQHRPGAEKGDGPPDPEL